MSTVGTLAGERLSSSPRGGKSLNPAMAYRLEPDPYRPLPLPSGWPRTKVGKATWAELERRRIALLDPDRPHDTDPWYVTVDRYGPTVRGVTFHPFTAAAGFDDDWSATLDELAAILGTGTAAPARRPREVAIRVTAAGEVVDATTGAPVPVWPVTPPSVPVVDLDTVAHPTPAAAAASTDRLAAYLDRLVYAPKRAYAAAYAAHVVDGAPCPPDPGTPWAVSVRAKVTRYTRKAA